MKSFAPSRHERAGRRSRTQGEALKSKSNGWHDTGAFTGVGQPKVVGVSAEVALASSKMNRDAAKAMKAFRRSLPKGVKI
jgi:hypothetical protein